MFRFLSFLIFLAGLAAAALGAITYFKIDVSDYLPAPAQPVAERVVDYGTPEDSAAVDAPGDAPAPAAMEAALPAPITAETPTAEETAPTTAKTAKPMRNIARSIGIDPVLAPEGVTLDFSDGAAAAPAPTGPSAEERFLESLKTVPVAHQTPRQVEYMRPFDVVLSIDATGDVTATDSLSGEGVIVEGEAKVSEQVEVRLIGAKFDIQANSPSTQKLSPVTENTWRWAVTPLTTGEHDLVFEIFAIDQGDVTPLRTFRDRVTVQVSGLNKAIAMANEANPIFVLLGGIGSALGGLWGTLKFFGKN